MKLSIIIPVYNEEKTVSSILDRIVKLKLKNFKKEVIVVDDGSTDTTASKIKNYTSAKLSASKSKIKNLKIFFHAKNQGKGAAVITGIKKATGEYIIIQDADLEYNPQEILKLIEPIQKGKAKVVFGTRLKRLPDFTRDEKSIQFFAHYIGNKFLSLVTSILYLQWITDMETCYKLFPRQAVFDMDLRARGFEFEPEITAKLLKRGHKIVEIPISTTPRSYKEGKKISAIKDGPRALWTLIKYRFTD